METSGRRSMSRSVHGEDLHGGVRRGLRKFRKYEKKKGEKIMPSFASLRFSSLCSASSIRLKIVRRRPPSSWVACSSPTSAASCSAELPACPSSMPPALDCAPSAGKPSALVAIADGLSIPAPRRELALKISKDPTSPVQVLVTENFRTKPVELTEDLLRFL